MLRTGGLRQSHRKLGGQCGECSAEAGESAPAPAVRHRENDAVEAATPLKCVEHLTPQISDVVRTIAEDAAAPGAQEQRRAASRMRRAECSVHARSELGAVCSAVQRHRRMERSVAVWRSSGDDRHRDGSR